MADRTSAGIFGRLFEELAKPGEIDKAKLAAWLWEQKEHGGYDFSDYQMCADEALLALGLASRCPFDLDGETCGAIAYGPVVAGRRVVCDECDQPSYRGQNVAKSSETKKAEPAK